MWRRYICKIPPSIQGRFFFLYGHFFKDAATATVERKEWYVQEGSIPGLKYKKRYLIFVKKKKDEKDMSPAELKDLIGDLMIRHRSA